MEFGLEIGGVGRILKIKIKIKIKILIFKTGILLISEKIQRNLTLTKMLD